MDKIKQETLKTTSVIDGGTVASPIQNSLFGMRFSTPVFGKLDEGSSGGGGGGNAEADAVKVAEAEATAKAEADAAKAKASDGDDELEALKAKLAASEEATASVTAESMKRKKQIKELNAKIGDAETGTADLMEKLQELLGEEISAESVSEKIKAKKEKEEEALRKSGDYEALNKRILTEHQKQIDGLNGKYGADLKASNEKLDAAQKTIRQLLVTNSFASSQYIADELTLTPTMTEKLYGENFKIEVKDGVSTVIAYNGSEPLVDGGGVPLSFEQALAEIISLDPGKDSVMKSKAKPGSGSGGGDADANKVPPTIAPGTGRITAALNERDK